MRCAIISDIHSNLEALTAVLDAIDGLEADGVYCLGDVVGYNADPVECTRAVLSRSSAIVRGNHDKAVAGLLGLEWFSRAAREAALWTREHIDGETMEALQKLPEGPMEPGEGVLLCHGTPFDEDAYLINADTIAETYRFMELHHPEARFCLHGHTHFPLVVERRPGAGKPEVLRWKEELALEPDATYLINPGSVGQPRDGKAQASFGILDTNRMTYRNIRVSYGVRDTQRKILQAGLPAELAHLLAEGR
jgi:predicted phosphodiesterase